MLNSQIEELEEQLLWSLLLSGDSKAFSYFYRKYVDDLFAYGMRFTSDRELVKDSIHDVFVKLYNNSLKLKNTNNVKLYLFIALKHTIFNVFQKKKADFHIDTIEPVFTTEYTVEDEIIVEEQEKEWKDKMDYILGQLTPRQREVIYYRYVEGMELNDICKLMDMNYQSVQNLIQRSIKKMKDILIKKDARFIRMRWNRI